MLTRLLLRRAAQALGLLLAVSLLSFLLLELAPGDFFAEMRLDPRISQEAVAALRARYGLDRPWHERYLRWLGALARGDLGHSFAYGLPVSELIGPRARHTLLLTSLATALAWLLAVPLGVWFAASRGRWPDRAGGAATAVLLAVPELLLALGLLLLAVRTRAFPAGGMTSPDHESFGVFARVADVAWHLVLPAGALVLGALPPLVRHVRAALLEVLDAPYVRAARAHGIPEARILWRHALPAAANPLTSLFGLSVAGLLSSSLVVEIVLGWPGLGPMLLEAILARDLYLVLGPLLLSTLLLIAGNLIADLLLYATDPRVRSGAT